MTRTAAILAVLLLGAACRARGPQPYRVPDERDRDPVRAEALSREAADLMATDPARAEALLRDALTADLFCGQAHNNLGVLYLKQGRLYEAAHELEWARKLLPGIPEPRLNLALVLERAGQDREALECVNAALEVAPEHLPSLQALARMLVERGEKDERLRSTLEAIALRGDADWRTWARERLSSGSTTSGRE